MLTADELRRMREAATPGPWGWGESTSANLCEEGIVSDSGDVFVNSGRGSGEPSDEDTNLILYLVNHAAEIEEALRDRERLEWLEKQDCWIGIKESDFGYGCDPKITAGGAYRVKVRAAIDAARKEGE